MAQLIQSIRGMNDCLPEETAAWRHLEQQFITCVTRYGYQEIRVPLIESTALFKRSIGEVTDVVEKEMYTFTDLNGESLSLRPEGTAGVVRACLQHGRLYHQQQKLWYSGPMFRHERPQKGRYRQFHHFGVEALGIPGTLIELELLSLCHRLWTQLHITDSLNLEINTLGTTTERQHYRQQLVDYLTQHEAALDFDSRRRLTRNPLRILDSKNPDMQALIQAAPQLVNAIGADSRAAFDRLCEGLTALNIPFTLNPRLVRGLDYYGHTTFEWVTDRLGSQATVCGGGRYDGLVSQLGGGETPAIGFAMGVERLALLLKECGQWPTLDTQPYVYLITEDTQPAQIAALQLAERLRAQGFSVLMHPSGGGFKSQFKKADQSRALIALILGEAEIAAGTIGVKWLREERPQQGLSQEELVKCLSIELKKNN